MFCWTFINCLIVGFLGQIISIFALNPCTNKSNGFHTKYGDCQNYFHCLNGHLTQNYTCSPGQVYNSEKLRCVQKTNWHCIDIQCPQSNTTNNGNDQKFYTIPGTQCGMYYQCSNDHREDFTCSHHMSFSFELQKCVKHGLCYDPVCTGHTNGYHPDTTQLCDRSFCCSGSQLITLRHCESGYRFSKSLKKCVLIPNEECERPEETAIAYPVQQRVNPCINLEDGPYITPNSQCKEYFICKSRTNLGTLSCAPGYMFNGINCVTNEKPNQCRDLGCSLLPNGLYSDIESGCQDYFYCLNHEVIDRQTCPSNMIHNGVRCVDEKLYKCPDPTFSSNPCLHRKDGYHRNNARCDEYFYCMNHEKILEGKCPNDQVWNGHICVEKGWFFCDGPKKWDGCLIASKGFYQDTSSSSQCTQYYYCDQGNVTRYSCPPSESFDGEKCVSKYTYKCPVNGNGICESLPDGYYPDLEDECRSYFYCANGMKNIFLCSTGEIFNGEKCVAENLYKCPVVASSKYSNEFCYDRKDGYFVKPGTDCRKYLRCENRKVIKELSCRDGFVFDLSLSECVIKSSKCVRVEVDENNSNCLRDGFFQDINSGCRSYYFCIDGLKTILECPDGEVFNGNICVRNNRYKCPTFCVYGIDKDYCDN